MRKLWKVINDFIPLVNYYFLDCNWLSLLLYLTNPFMFHLCVMFAAFKRLSRLEGIIPALETSHALAYLEKLCPTLPNGTKVVLNCSGRGDKDVQTAIKYLKV